MSEDLNWIRETGREAGKERAGTRSDRRKGERKTLLFETLCYQAAGRPEARSVNFLSQRTDVPAPASRGPHPPDAA